MLAARLSLAESLSMSERGKGPHWCQSENFSERSEISRKAGCRGKRAGGQQEGGREGLMECPLVGGMDLVPCVGSVLLEKPS